VNKASDAEVPPLNAADQARWDAALRIAEQYKDWKPLQESASGLIVVRYRVLRRWLTILYWVAAVAVSVPTALSYAGQHREAVLATRDAARREFDKTLEADQPPAPPSGLLERYAPGSSSTSERSTSADPGESSPPALSEPAVSLLPDRADTPPDAEQNLSGQTQVEPEPAAPLAAPPGEAPSNPPRSLGVKVCAGDGGDPDCPRTHPETYEAKDTGCGYCGGTLKWKQE